MLGTFCIYETINSSQKKMNQVELKNKTEAAERALLLALQGPQEFIVKNLNLFIATRDCNNLCDFADVWKNVPNKEEILEEMERRTQRVEAAKAVLAKAQAELDAAFPYARSDEEKKEDVMVLIRRRYKPT